MIAPRELSRNAKIVFSEKAAATTHAKPTIDENRIALRGTPRGDNRTNAEGASLRAARTNSMRDAVYMPEFRQDSTAVSTTAFMMWSAYGIPIAWNAATYGEASSAAEFQGRITASRKIEPTKKIAIGMMTELVALAMARAGSADSAAAMVLNDTPTTEKITTTIA